MTREKRISINNKLMEKFTALNNAGVDVIASATEYGTWSTFTCFVVGNSDKTLIVEMTDNGESVNVSFAGIEKSYTAFNNKTIEIYLAVFTAVASL